MAGKTRLRRPQIQTRKRGLILCEGETETNYFKGMVTQDEYRRKFSSVSVEIFKPKDHSPVGLVEQAKNLIKIARKDKNNYDFVWLVLDRDRHPRLAEAFEMVRTSEGKIQIAFSNPCFEYFVLLHFMKTTKPFGNCDEVVKYVREKAVPDYEKAANPFKLLLPRLCTGIQNSIWLCKQNENDINKGKMIYDLSAYTDVHKLVLELYKQIEVDICPELSTK